MSHSTASISTRAKSSVRPGHEAAHTIAHTTAHTTADTGLRRMTSPIGRLELTSDGTAITSLTIEKGGQLPLDGLAEAPDRVLDRAVRQLEEYFANRRRSFKLPLAPRGTAFQRAIWDQLSALEWGETTSYGELGLGTGRASAGRAVGGAIGANPIPIIIPCHRVLGSDGRITGYSGGEGIPTKLWLLEHEGVLLAA